MSLTQNFGRNVDFAPARRCTPGSEAEVLDLLRQCRNDRIRCIGAGHSWSRIAATDRVLVDLRHFEAVTLLRSPPDALVQVGAGCTLRRLLRALEPHGLTLPALGVITAQTVAGATATGTHGSGESSLSHFMVAARIATYDPVTGDPRILTVHEEPELLAARCSLGSLGIVLRAVVAAVPEYRIEERQEALGSLDAVLAGEAEWPLQQFALFPWSWNYVAIRRRTTILPRRALRARLKRWTLWAKLELGLHSLLKAVLCWARLAGRRGHGIVRWFFRRLLPWFVGGHRRIDNSAAILTQPAHWWRYVEMEVFVPRAELAAAIRTIRELVEVASGEHGSYSADVAEGLERAGLTQAARSLYGTWTHHYPLFFRTVDPDETLVSMAAGRQPWISISFISYAGAGGGFHGFAETIARCLMRLHGARLHWGKYFPVPFRDAAASYPRFQEFEAICQRYDSRRVFWNTNL